MEDILRFLKLYDLPYFSRSKLTGLNAVKVTTLSYWRRQNYKRKPPTITMNFAEMNNFEVTADWCYRRRYFKKKVEFDRPSPFPFY